MEIIIAFLLTPWIFITLIFIGVVINLLAIEVESFYWNTFIVILLLLLINLEYNIFGWIGQNPLDFILYFVGYFVVGLFWSFGKWYSKLSKIARKIKKAKAKYGNEWDSKEIFMFLADIRCEFPDDMLDSKHINEDILDLFPKIRESKALVVAWIMYWPFSLVSTLINDPIRRIGNYLFETFQRVYERIYDNVTDSI